ncbi:YihY/virulence factor BrkB family protein [Streptomyces sp. Z26]|uniref:YihY/virulence factor BrkB family protein n=1 Tax=Streptomyces sp. Z26 TaxID=2500177 RepID=UPI001F0C2BC9|nr:YihY/virulence factor BrkB family protein [Streptomyces sp. Z26]
MSGDGTLGAATDTAPGATGARGGTPYEADAAMDGGPDANAGAGEGRDPGVAVGASPDPGASASPDVAANTAPDPESDPALDAYVDPDMDEAHGARRAGNAGRSRSPGEMGRRVAAPLKHGRTGEYGVALRRAPLSVWNDDDVTDRAAALTYYSVLAIFPTLLVVVSVIGIAGKSATEDLISALTTLLPADSRELMRSALEDMAAQRSAAWLLASIGTAGALWSATSYLSVFRRALHAMHGIRDRRPALSRVPMILLTALVLLGLLVSSALALMLSKEVARTVGRLLGWGDEAVQAWQVLRWPLLLVLVAMLVLVLFRSGPTEARGVREGLPGGVVAVLLWLLTSFGFALYASHAGTYHRLYGPLAGFVVFLVWLWMSNLALLTGAQFNAELRRLRSR